MYAYCDQCHWTCTGDHAGHVLDEADYHVAIFPDHTVNAS